MLRGAVGKVMWVGRATVFLVGLAVILALVVGLASAAFGANGQAWRLGQGNVATAITALGGSSGVNGPMVRLTNNNADANDTALDLRVQSGEAPMTVNSDTEVADLRAATATQADSADNAAELGGQPAADYPRLCQNGTVFGRAEIDGAVATSTLSTTGVAGNSDFICNAPSENVQVKRVAIGHYQVVFGSEEHSGVIGDFFSAPSPGPRPMVSSRTTDLIVSATGPLQCSASPPPEISCYEVKVEDSNSQLQVDGDFTITVM